MGDINARVGDGVVESVVGTCSVPGVNDSGEIMSELCVERDLVSGSNQYIQYKRIILNKHGCDKIKG